MSEKHVHWGDLALFLEVAREGGLSPASRTTGRSAATLGRRMRELERNMNRDLFVRHERGYELTAQGRDLMADLSEIEARMMRIVAARGDASHPLVKVSAGNWTTLALTAVIDQLTGNPADVRLRLIATEARLDFARREAVIGFRNRRPMEAHLAARRLSPVEFAAYARPEAPDRWIKVIADTPSARWLDRVVGTDAICEVTNPRLSLDLALAGRGKALLPTFIGDACDDLKRLGPCVGELTHDRWIVTHQDDRHIPEVRRTINRLCTALSGGSG